MTAPTMHALFDGSDLGLIPDGAVKRFDCTNGGASWCQGCYTMTEADDGDYVRADDYAALLAEHEALLRRVADAPAVAIAENGGYYASGAWSPYGHVKGDPHSLALGQFIGQRVRILAEPGEVGK